MKKIFAFLLTLITVFALISCDVLQKENTDGMVENKKEGTTSDNHDTVDSGDGHSKDGSAMYVAVNDIVFSSDFSEGLAVIALKEDMENFYVIDKTGKVIFTIKNDDLTNNGMCQNSISYSAGMNLYKNGKMLFIDGLVYDTIGNVITPEQVGATSFLYIKDGKYIVAEKINSTYDSMKTELGVLDMNLTWISPLSEENNNRYIRYDENIEFWESILGGNQNNIEDFDFGTITNHVEHTKFVNGKAGVMMYNRQSSEVFVSIIDSQGNFLFTPQKLDGEGTLLNPSLYFDGNMLVSSARSNGFSSLPLTVCCYNLNGEKIGSFDSVSAGLCKSNSDSVTFSYNDGVIVFRISKGTYSEYNRQSKVKYYNCDFKELIAS